MERSFIKSKVYLVLVVTCMVGLVIGIGYKTAVPTLFAGSNEESTSVINGGNQIFMPMVSVSLAITTTADGKDWNPGDGRCETAPGNKTCTLRAYIQEMNAQPGKDTIYVPAGLYTLTSVGANEDNGDTGDLDILDDLIIVGENPNTTIVNGNSQDRIFDIIGARVSISNLTVTNGGSSGTSGGGGILSTGHLTMTNSIVSNNVAGKQGGGIKSASNTLTLFNTTVSNNVSIQNGGGIFAQFLTMSDSVVSNNVVNPGGSGSDGGGLFISFSLVMDKSTISNNRLDKGAGGGIFLTGNAKATITRSNIQANVLTGNSTGVRGAGIYSESNQTVSISDTTIQGNNTSSSGGGIYHDPSGASGTMNLKRVTIRQNVAPSRGGGIYSNGNMNLTNVTVSGNRAEGNLNKEGGGIFHKNGYMMILNSTLSENKAEEGGAIYRESGMVTLENSILADNIATAILGPGDPDTHNCWGSIISAGHNIEDGVFCFFSAPSDLSNTNPMLLDIVPGSIWSYVYPLASNSPAIDSANNATCPAEDQRGVPRPIDGDGNGVAVCDRGSYEYP